MFHQKPLQIRSGVLMSMFCLTLLFSACKSKPNETIVRLEKQIEKMQNEKLQLENNKQLARNFFTEVFIQLQLDAINKYIANEYIQHDPFIADGKQALVDEVSIWFEHMKPNQVDIIRTMAEDYLVFIHTRNRTGEKTMSLMHVFRIEKNMIAEHWITVQEVPEKAKNNNTMF